MGTACAVILFVLAPKLAGMMLLGIPLVVVPITVLGRRVRADLDPAARTASPTSARSPAKCSAR